MQARSLKLKMLYVAMHRSLFLVFSKSKQAEYWKKIVDMKFYSSIYYQLGKASEGRVSMLSTANAHRIMSSPTLNLMMICFLASL